MDFSETTHTHELESNVSNYRPISLLPVFNIVLEKLMYKRLSSLRNATLSMINNLDSALIKAFDTVN